MMLTLPLLRSDWLFWLFSSCNCGGGILLLLLPVSNNAAESELGMLSDLVGGGPSAGDGESIGPGCDGPDVFILGGGIESESEEFPAMLELILELTGIVILCVTLVKFSAERKGKQIAVV